MPRLVPRIPSVARVELYGEIVPKIHNDPGNPYRIGEIWAVKNGTLTNSGYNCCPYNQDLFCNCPPIGNNYRLGGGAYVIVRELVPNWHFAKYDIADVSFAEPANPFCPQPRVWNADGTLPENCDVLVMKPYSAHNPTLVTMDREGYFIRATMSNRMLKTTIYPYDCQCKPSLPQIGQVVNEPGPDPDYHGATCFYDPESWNIESWAIPFGPWEFQYWILNRTVPRVSGPYINFMMEGIWNADPYYSDFNNEIEAVFVPRIQGEATLGTMTVEPAGTPRPIYNLDIHPETKSANIEMDANTLYKGETITQRLTLINRSQGKIHVGAVTASGLPAGLSFSFILDSAKFLAPDQSVGARAILKVASTASFPRNEIIYWTATLYALPATNWDLFKTIGPDGVVEHKQVDIFGSIILSNAFGSREGESRYNRLADINGDGKVDIFDNILYASHFGESVI